MTIQLEQRALALLQTKMRQLYPKGRLLPASISKFTVARDPKTRGAQVSFSVTTLQGIGAIALLRNTARDPGTAKQLQLWTRQMLKRTPQRFPFPCTYADADQAIVGQTVYYWLRIQPANDLWNAQTVGPMVLDNTANAGAPGALVAFDLSHQGAGPNGTVVISGAFQASSDGKTQSVKLYVAGYQGVAAQVAVAQLERSPFNFSLAMTGEAVVVTAVAVSSEGVESAGVTKNLTLNAVATVPAEVMPPTALFLPGGVQIGWNAGDSNEAVTQFLIYRGAHGAGFGAAVQIATVAWSGATAYTYLDAAGLGPPYDWFVVAQNATGNSMASAAAYILNAFDANHRLTDTGRLMLVNASSTPTTQPLSATNPSGSATISIASFVVQYPFGTVSYNSGSITGLASSTKYYVYCDDPNYAGGAVTYHATTSNPTVTAGEGRLFVGIITTPASGGGGTSGSGGGNGPCFSGNTLIRTTLGPVAIANIVPGDWIHSIAGPRRVRRLLAHRYVGVMLEMARGELVTPSHKLRSDDGHWLKAHCFFGNYAGFDGTVFNLEIEGDGSDDEQCYQLENGRFAHNVQK
ncbi:MAG TPA: Hint domain-containing protein [Terriglobia bacterium]|nr:Hint domain-containing protein [Terriglobia bacterium]